MNIRQQVYVSPPGDGKCMLNDSHIIFSIATYYPSFGLAAKENSLIVEELNSFEILGSIYMLSQMKTQKYFVISKSDSLLQNSI